VIVLDPFERARDEEAFHLVATEIVDVSVPVPVKALARILVFIERRAVEAGKAPDVGGKMGRHPIDDDADFRLMTAIDQRSELRRAAVAPGRREQAERFILQSRCSRGIGLGSRRER
jgi:hypothetical protein